MSLESIDYYEFQITGNNLLIANVSLKFNKENNLGQLVYLGKYREGEESFEFRINPSSKSLADVLYSAAKRINQEFNQEDPKTSRKITRGEFGVGGNYERE